MLDAPERERYLPTDVIGHLRMRAGADPNVVAVHVPADAVSLPAGGADRVLAVNLLHEVRRREAIAALASAGLRAVPARVELPLHFALIATPTE